MNKERSEQWIEDIEEFSIKLPKLHKNLFFKLNKSDFYGQINYLIKNVQHFDDYEMYVQIAKVAASIGDAHTSVKLPVKNLCPLELYWFPDGIYVISTVPEYKDTLYCRISHINNIEINEVIEIVSTVVSHENQSFLRAQLPVYLTAMEVLYGLEIVDDTDNLKVTFLDANGKIKIVNIKPIPMGEARERLKTSQNNIVENMKLPVYRRNVEKYFWSEYIKTLRTVYFKYNSCKDMDEVKVSEFSEEMLSFINENDVNKIVIDFRNNCGGNSTLLDSFIDELSKCKKINKEGGLYVIIGRDTFSSALLNAFSLKEKTKALFIGEPTGGKPNCYGEVERFKLKNSGLMVAYSTQYYKLIEDDEKPSLYPDINIEVGIHNFINNEDPCLEYILKD